MQKELIIIDALKKFFPLSFKEGDTKQLIVTIVIYVIVALVVGLVLGLLGKIPLIGWIFRLVSWLIRVYCIAGVVLAILYFLNIVK